MSDYNENILDYLLHHFFEKVDRKYVDEADRLVTRNVELTNNKHYTIKVGIDKIEHTMAFNVKWVIPCHCHKELLETAQEYLVRRKMLEHTKRVVTAYLAKMLPKCHSYADVRAVIHSDVSHFLDSHIGEGMETRFSKDQIQQFRIENAEAEQTINEFIVMNTLIQYY